MEIIWNLINGSRTEVPDNDYAAFVDVRDIARAHLRAYLVKEAANQRFLAAAGQFLYQNARVIIRGRFPQLEGMVPKGVPGTGLETYIVDGSKAERALGFEYRSLDSVLADTVEDLLGALSV
ncbi:methylglyoxal reductase (NADPH-dependent) gre2 [Aspergillus alliaceus]|uniref:Methylglyoxal reductase (NADPH-dependent) gre2 n=1 Tax=Petromyces alliaceus TaxID=209559 RepID=A0A8H5ZZY6_PETAA|nr:methylglyoxal reductase (NADPH-dependent) gre2 [Aspergillus burnettii]